MAKNDWTKTLVITISEKQKKWVKATAKSLGLTASGYVRMIISEMMKAEIEAKIELEEGDE